MHPSLTTVDTMKRERTTQLIAWRILKTLGERARVVNAMFNLSEFFFLGGEGAWKIGVLTWKPLDERQITHLICARLKYDLYDFFRGGGVGPFIQEKERKQAQSTP